MFDLIFIDAAKLRNRFFLDKFSKNLNVGGTIIVDNMQLDDLWQGADQKKKAKYDLANKEFKEVEEALNDFDKALKQFAEATVVAINDLTDAEQLAYLLKYDTNHRNYRIDEISFEGNDLVVGERKIPIYAEKDPANLPWKDLDIDVVFECTGLFTSEEKAMAHINAGAKHVIISAPASGDLKTIVYNVNHKILTGDEKIISAASCTTNCLAPVVDVLDKEFGIVKGFMTTVHAYTNDQASLDIAHKKGERVLVERIEGVKCLVRKA